MNPFKLLIILITLFLVGCGTTTNTELGFRDYETIIKNNFKSTGKQPQIKNVSEVEKMLEDIEKPEQKQEIGIGAVHVGLHNTVISTVF